MDPLDHVDEGRHQIKRVYRESKRIRINEKGAALRDTIIKYVGKNYVREQDLNNYLIRLEEDRDGHSKINKTKWFKRNTKFFNTFEKNSEKYISLSKYGQRVLELLNRDKNVPKEINESSFRNIPSLEEHIITESHDIQHPIEMENNRMMRSSVAEFTEYLLRKAEESKPENFREVSEGPDYDEASFQMDKIFGDDQESIEVFQDIEDNGDVKDMIDYIDNYGDEDQLQRYGIKSTAHVKGFAKHIMRKR